MSGLLGRLLRSGIAYQAAAVLGAVLAVVTLPLYTHHLSEADFGYAETLLTAIILASILLRLGIGEAFVRFWSADEDPVRRARLARTTWGSVLAATTAVGLVLLAVAGPLGRLLLDRDDATLMAFGLLGLWAFTNLEVAYAILRVSERRREYAAASAVNVVLTVALTVLLVVVLDEGARGYVLGNYAASTVVLLALWWRERAVLLPQGRVALAPLLRFGVPTVPAEATVFLLNVIDRAYLLRVESAAAAGLYAVAAKLSTAVIVTVRGFQAAWPPLAYSVADDEEAGRLYATVTTLYVAVTGAAVCGLTLLSRQVTDLLTAPAYAGAHEALPWLALGWALYGLNLVLVTVAGRARVTTRNFPAAAAGVVVNVVALVTLVGPLGIAGAGIALCLAYVVLIAVLHGLTRSLFAVPFEWGRLARVVGVLTVIAVGGELLLPTDGAAGWGTRIAALALVVPAMLAAGVLTGPERARLRALASARRS